MEIIDFGYRVYQVLNQLLPLIIALVLLYWKRPGWWWRVIVGLTGVYSSLGLITDRLPGIAFFWSQEAKWVANLSDPYDQLMLYYGILLIVAAINLVVGLALLVQTKRRYYQ